jgi:hypothetical protein
VIARDLHALTRLEGIDVVAAAVGVTPRALVDMRRGETPITVDELHAIGERWPDFDLAATVKRLGIIREVHGKSKRARLAVEVPRAGSLPECATCPKPRPCDGCPALQDAIDGRR